MADCAECHEGQPDPAAFSESVHGFLECADCHSGAEKLPHPDEVGRVDCSVCHEAAVEEYGASIHGQARESGTTEAPSCATCHGDVHELLPPTDPASPVHPVRLPETCAICHADPEVVAKFGIPLARPSEAYHDSVHARMRERGEQGATCNSCHGTHAIFPARDPRSMVNHLNVPTTCGQCHGEVAEIYGSSIHGKAAAHGIREAPVCTDCHGEHRILSPGERGSPVYATNIPKMTCGRCHGDLRLAEKYGIDPNKVPAYRDSYHGLASRAGALTVAHCGSCHGVHDILPSSDPRSHTHADNLARTCGGCHPGAGQRFAIGPVHVLPTEQQHAATYYVRLAYLWLIYATIGAMLLHNALDLLRKTRNPLPHHVPCRTYERMPRGFRVAHGLVMVSFVILVYTGFALTYPESWWARPVTAWEADLGLRGWLHRGAALVLLAGVVFHLVHLARDRGARAAIRRVRPRLHDLRELRERLDYFLGRRATPPRSGTFGYAEKLEYLALAWGVVIMALSGFVLWFENLALRWLPKWLSDVATVIHFYEAVLATLAILVWHFYFVIFDPAVYPMDTAWLTGREVAGRSAERHHYTPPKEAGAASKATKIAEIRR